MDATAGAALAPPRRCWLSWSSGKDCCYALHVLMRNPTVEVVGLMTTINEVGRRGRLPAGAAAAPGLLRAAARGCPSLRGPCLTKPLATSPPPSLPLPPCAREPQTANRVAMHAVRARLLQEQADAAGLPVYQVRSSGGGGPGLSAGQAAPLRHG
jgi:hypothetical protein